MIDPQAQAENLEYMKLLALVMWKEQIGEVLLTSEDLLAFEALTNQEGEHAITIGPNPNERTIRIRFMKTADAKKERGWPGSA